MWVVFYIAIFILGACLGSFLCCQARRLQRKSTKKSKLGSRSVCLYCKHRLKWYENLPIISWILQRGKCRHCHKKIGIAELLSELATGATLVTIFIAFRHSILSYGVTTFGVFPEQIATNTISTTGVFNWVALAIMVLLSFLLIFLSIYDGLYGELPTFALIISAVLAVSLVLVKLTSINATYQPLSDASADFAHQLLIDSIFAIAILGGIYLVLYLVSKGKWVGDGDWILGSVIAAALGTPWLALITLFFANFSATIITYPTIKKRRDHKIFFGPFLVFAFVLTLFLSSFGVLDLC